MTSSTDDPGPPCPTCNDTGTVIAHYSETSGAHSMQPCHCRPSVSYTYETYRVEWLAQVIWVNQYGARSGYDPVWSEVFPTKESAERALATRARWDEQVHRWVTGVSYQEGEVFQRKVLVSTT